MKPYSKWTGTVCVVACVLAASALRAGSLDPTGAPGPTMRTLEEIYQRIQSLDPDTQQLLSETVTSVNAGYYASTNLTQVDTDLTASNIMKGVTILGVTGTMYNAAVQKTGLTTSYLLGDDGDYKKGVVWPNSRFTLGESGESTNCVTDNLTGLVWARNANINGTMTWAAAIAYCEALNYGGQTDWRLPNAKELYSLIDLGRVNPALPLGHPFVDVQSDIYWSSSTYIFNTVDTWTLRLGGGDVRHDNKAGPYYVWPVRGGQ